MSAAPALVLAPAANASRKRGIGRTLGVYSRFDAIKMLGVHRISLEEAEKRAAARELRYRQSLAMVNRLLKSGID